LAYPRTQEDFDKWYNESGGDPWHYQSRNIKRRLKYSHKLLLKYLPPEFSGNIFELGAFRGDFTIYLCRTYNNARIYANDISEVALEAVKERTKDFNNVILINKDLLHINKSDIRNSGKTIILLFECLYYLKADEREDAIKNIKENFPSSDIFLSVPVTGKHYFTEKDLISMMQRNSYFLKDFKVLNLRKFSYLRLFLKPLANMSDAVRDKVANQVFFYFKPTEQL
jgi:SAM-dependent methyltransferase